ncbi:MAG: hypothetical protein AAF801_09190, partial [Pseudomonadota bacterium]
KVRQAEDIRSMAERELREFLAEQRGLLGDMSDKSELGVDDLKDIFGITAQQEREELFDYIFEELSDSAPVEAIGNA